MGMFTPPKHLIPPLVCPGVLACPFLRISISFGIYENDICLLHYPFIQKPLHDKKNLAVAFSPIFRYVDDVLSIINNKSHTYIDSIYPNELEIKDITKCFVFRYISLKLNTNDKITTELFDKRSQSSTFLTYVAIFHHHLHIVYIFRS
jgi:hypothetical protein